MATTPSYKISGAVTGLQAPDESVTLRLTYGLSNTTEEITVSHDPIFGDTVAFEFSAEVEDGSSYTVTVVSQPASNTCSMTASETGAISADVSDVGVDCT